MRGRKILLRKLVERPGPRVGRKSLTIQWPADEARLDAEGLITDDHLVSNPFNYHSLFSI